MFIALILVVLDPFKKNLILPNALRSKTVNSSINDTLSISSPSIKWDVGTFYNYVRSSPNQNY